jgi:DNA invertase Pin-like site-specific DNA recombinase
MKLAYLRTSTADQENGITAQRNALKAIGCEKFFTDQGFSGGKFANCPAWNQLLGELDAHHTSPRLRQLKEPGITLAVLTRNHR